jgi:hypothetical protein
MKISRVSSDSRSNTRLSIITALISIIAISAYLLVSPRPVKSALVPAVAINKYFNSGTAAGDVFELLVIQDNLDMRGMIVKDFSSNSVRSGTLIVLRNDNSAADTTVGGADFNLDIGMTNTTFFTSGGGTFDIATTDMIMIKAAGSGTAGVTGSLHVLAGGAAGTQFNNAPAPKLIASGTSPGGQFVFANNSTQNGMDFDGTDATGNATGLTRKAIAARPLRLLRSACPRPLLRAA